MKRTISLITTFLLIIAFSACSNDQGEIKFYKNYDNSTGSVSNKINKVPVGTEFYIQIKSNKPFNKEFLNITAYSEKNGAKSIIGGASTKVDPDSNTVVVPFTMVKEGKFKIDVYTDKPDNIIVSGNMKVESK